MERNEVNKTIVICDTGPVLHLDELECLYLLKDFHQVILPETVVREIEEHRPGMLKNQFVPFKTVSISFPVDPQLFMLCQVFALHAGELEALSLMADTPHAMFLTDDCAARLVAQKMGYSVHGTIGILIRAIRRNMMTPQNVVAILERIPEKSSLHIKASLLDAIIVQIKQEFDL
jgi:predicted nucleic acid-binding protein